MAQALSDIYNSLNSAYNPQRDLYNQQISTLPAQQAAQQQGLDTQKSNAFTGIQNNANASGMYYSGAPISEEQKYTGGTYLPAVANLQAQTNQQKYGLQQALAGVGVNQTSAAQGILQNQVQNDQQTNYYNQQLAQQKAYNDQMASMYSRGSSSYGGGSSGGGAVAQAPTPQHSMQSDIANAFNGFGARARGYTESTIIPALQAAYGNTPAVAQAVYQYRKQQFGG